MVLNAAVQALRQAEELKQKLLDVDKDTIVTTNKTILLTQLQKAYQKVLLLDLDYALDKKVEQDLWNLGFKNQIESLQNSTKDKKNPRRAESQTLLNWCIQAATGFYISFLHQICSSFKLNLPFRCNVPLVMDCPQTWKMSSRPPQASSCWYICQYCLVHLGDLARYTRHLKMASSFYRQALTVSPSNGQPYNQLGLLRASRGDRLGAAYYHARGLAVGGPFPPAHNNLARTLAQANSVTESTPASESGPVNLLDGSLSYARLNPSLFLANYMSLHHHILTSGDLDKAQNISKGITSTLIALVATQQFQHETLMQVCCLSMYSVFSLTEGHVLCSSETTPLTEDEQSWLDLAVNTLAGIMEALLLPVHTTPNAQYITYVGLPDIKILMEWLRLHPEMLKHSAFVSRPQLWPGLSLRVLLSGLRQCIKDFNGDMYDTIPLPEDEELRGFLPVDKAFVKLKYANIVSSEIYGDSIIEIKYVLPSDDSEMSEKEIISLKKQVGFSVSEGETLKKDKNFVDSLRSFRLTELGKWLVDWQKSNGIEYISISIVDEMEVFKPVQSAVDSDPELEKTIRELSILREKRLSECKQNDLQNADEGSDNELKSVSLSKSSETSVVTLAINTTDKAALGAITSGDMSPFLEPEISLTPLIITEADFREKVREKKAGILKPQGSLERARIEKAALTRAATKEPLGDLTDPQDNQDTGSSCSTVSQDGNICSDVGSLLEPSMPKEKGRKTRTNVALQAILRKQEETSKQVKFLTPVTTPDSISEPTPQLSPQPIREPEKKIIQPKIVKSLASLPTDRKTGGILSLKDKSGGYPHLQNTETVGEAKNDTVEAIVDDSTKSSVELSSEKITTTPKAVAKRDTSNTVSSSSNDKPFLSRFTTWSDNVNNRVDVDKLSASGRLQAAQPNFSYFSPPGTTPNMSITLPVVNPKEIDVLSALLHKQRNMYGVGEQFPSAESYNADNNAMSPYNYWGGPQNIILPDSPRYGNPGYSNNAYVPSSSSNDKPFLSWYTTWSDNVNNRVDVDKLSASGRLQAAQPNFSYFSPPGTTQNMSITLPVVNPKEIDVRSALLHKQRNMYGVGEQFPSAESYNADNNAMSPYNYWGGPQNIILPDSPRYGNPGYSNNAYVPSSSSNDKPFLSWYTTWSDNVNNRVDVDKLSASGRLQAAQPNFSYFSPPGTTQNMSITLPVVNPKEIDVRSASLHKQRNMYGVGEQFPSAESYNADNNAMSPYNYWGGPQNIQQGTPNNYQRLPPRFANLKHSPNELQPGPQDMQFAPQDNGPPSSYTGMFSPQAPQHTWWKPPTQAIQEQGYDRAPVYPSQNMLSPNYQQPNYHQPNLASPNYPMQTNMNATPYQQTNYFTQNQTDGQNHPKTPPTKKKKKNKKKKKQTDYSKLQYNSPILSDSPRYGNPGYSNNAYVPSSTNNYGPIAAYNPGMYPQFSNRFGFPSQPQAPKMPGNDYGANQHRPGTNPNMPSPSTKMGQALYHQGAPFPMSPEDENIRILFLILFFILFSFIFHDSLYFFFIAYFFMMSL